MPVLERLSWPPGAPRSVAGGSLSEPPKVPMPVLRGVEMTISPLPLPLPKLTLYSFRLYRVQRIHQKDRARTTRPRPLHARSTSCFLDYRLALRCASSRLPL